jgi:hypothetical protein
MAITADTWAVVAATGLGPVLAVALTLGFTYWRETSGAKNNRRLHDFRILMATRKIGISPDHVNALNLIEVDYYKKDRVILAWKAYIAYLNGKEEENEAWHKERNKLLAKLLFEMASVLGFSIQAIDIFEGGYAPSGWQHRDQRYTGMLEYFHDLSEGTKIVPIWLRGVTPQQPQEPPSVGPTLPKPNG